KAQLLTPGAVAPLLDDWFRRQGWRHVVVRTSPRVEGINARLADHGRDGFQVRLQRLFEVQLGGDNGEAIVVHVVAKSVGGGWLESHDDVWDGWKVLLGVLRRAYGSPFGRLKAGVLRRELRKFASPHPMLVDGRMQPDEWLAAPDGEYKLDYEHHNFGPAEP